MDENTQNATRQVYEIINTNSVLLQELKDILTELDISVNNIMNYDTLNLKFLVAPEQKCQVIKKKLEDNVATLNNLVSGITLDDEYFNNAADKLFKRAKYISDTIPSTTTPGSTVTADVVFENVSCFTNWTLSNQIKLKITITNVELQYSQTIEFNMGDLDDVGLNEQKTFNISFTAPSVKDTYIITMCISDMTWDFETNAIKRISIV